MIWISFGTWDHRGGRWLSWERIHGTIFCRVKIRYPSKRELLKRRDDLGKFIAIQSQSGNYDYSEYQFGFANGIIFAEAAMCSRKPDYLEKPKKWLKNKRSKRKKVEKQG